MVETVWNKIKRNPFEAMSLKDKEATKSYLFFIPLIIGLIIFFIIPTVKSFIFSISDVTSGAGGYSFSITGIAAYKEALMSHGSYRQTVVKSAMEVVTQTPLIILFSFFMASVLNQNFKGKTFFRVVLFLPVILTVMNVHTSSMEDNMGAFSSYKSTEETVVSFTSQITEFLIQAGLGEDIAGSITSMADSVYDVISLSAIQILIMLIAMQAISPSLYEAARVEGATGWESFWKITVPMVSPMIMTCVIYTIIDSFTATGNKVMTLMSDTAFNNLNFSLGSAMGWIYFALIAVILAIAAWLFSKVVLKYDS